MQRILPFCRRPSQQTTPAIVVSDVHNAGTSQNVPTFRPNSEVHEYAYIPEDEGEATLLIFILLFTCN